MRDIQELDIVFDTGYEVQIPRMYQVVLDGLLIVAAHLTMRDRTLTITNWQGLEFQFKCWGFSGNEMNSLWRDLSRALELVDKHWSVVYVDNVMECSYDIKKVI